MIPIKDKTYLIKFSDPIYQRTSYEGSGVYTGEIVEDDDEPELSKKILYLFSDLKAKNESTSLGLFASEDIIKVIN
jgi:hypothetical protein